jgi:hypothetical protein
VAIEGIQDDVMDEDDETEVYLAHCDSIWYKVHTYHTAELLVDFPNERALYEWRVLAKSKTRLPNKEICA